MFAIDDMVSDGSRDAALIERTVLLNARVPVGDRIATIAVSRGSTIVQRTYGLWEEVEYRTGVPTIPIEGERQILNTFHVEVVF